MPLVVLHTVDVADKLVAVDSCDRNLEDMLDVEGDTEDMPEEDNQAPHQLGSRFT